MTHSSLDADDKILLDNNNLVQVIKPSVAFSKVKEAVSRGLYLTLSPGIYNWEVTLTIVKNNQVWELDL